MATGRDPIERASDGDADLYEVSTWEPRTALDRFALSLYEGFRPAIRGALVISAAVLLGVLFFRASLGAVTDPAVGPFVVLSVVPALALAVYVWRADVTTGEPPSLLAVTFLLAVLFAQFAAVLNGVAGPAFGLLGGDLALVGSILFFFLVVGPVEEGVKLLAVRLYAFRRPRFDAVVDGAVYGAVAGLGFATIENALYITGFLAGPGQALPQFQAVTSIAATRAIAGPGHVIYSGIAGYYLGLAKFNPESDGPLVVKGLLVAAFVHATYNVTVGLVPPYLAATVGGLSLSGAFVGYVVAYDLAAGYYLYRKLARYRRAYDAVDGPGETAIDPEVTEFDAPAEDYR